MNKKFTNLILAGVMLSTTISPVLASSDVESAFEDKFKNETYESQTKPNSGVSVEQAYEERFKNETAKPKENTQEKTHENTDTKTETKTGNNNNFNSRENYTPRTETRVVEQAPRVEYVTVPSNNPQNYVSDGNVEARDAALDQEQASHNVSIKLTNAEGSIVKGVSVVLLEGDSELGQAQSNDEGIVKLNGIKPGNYVMKTTSVPETYRAGQMLEVKVTEENKDSQLTFVVEYNKITLKNQNNSKTEYEIYDAYQNKLLTKAESKSNGELVLNKVKPGLYYFKSGNVKSPNLSVNDKYTNSTVTFSGSEATITDDQTTIVRDGTAVNADGESTTKLIKTGINDKEGLKTQNILMFLGTLALAGFSIYNLLEIKKLKSKDEK